MLGTNQASTELHVQPDPPPSSMGSPRLMSKPQRALNMTAVSASSAFAASLNASSAAARSRSGVTVVSPVWMSSSAPSAGVAPTPNGRTSQKACSSGVMDATSSGGHNRRAVGCAPDRRAAVNAPLWRRKACVRGLLRVLPGVVGVVATPKGGPVDWGASRRREGLAGCFSAQVPGGTTHAAYDPGDVCVAVGAGKVEGGVAATSPGGGVDMMVNSHKKDTCRVKVKKGASGLCARSNVVGPEMEVASKTASSTVVSLAKAQCRSDGVARMSDDWRAGSNEAPHRALMYALLEQPVGGGQMVNRGSGGGGPPPLTQRPVGGLRNARGSAPGEFA